MKKNILKALVMIVACSMSSCGDSFLDTKIYNGVDLDGGLSTPTNIKTALNGAYYRLFASQFAGNYALSIGDIPTDLTYWNRQTSHWNTIYEYNYTTTDTYLTGIWEYGYKIVDNSARIIKGVEEIYDNATQAEKAQLDCYRAEAHALRAYATFILTNVYGHQVKVNGQDFSSKPGVVVVEEPIAALSKVSRGTVGDCYNQIISDYKKSLEYFTKAGGDQGLMYYMNVAGVNGLLARAYLYNEEWANAANAAKAALSVAGFDSETPGVVYTAAAYKGLYVNGSSNSESLFSLAIDASNNWSANSLGTLWSTYCFSPSPYLRSLYADSDIRTVIMDYDEPAETDASVPYYAAGKFHHYESGNPAYSNNFIVNAPEMYLIIAEAEFNQNGANQSAVDALMTVAKRNPNVNEDDIKADFKQFLMDERARELFQEGLRLWDLRRWGVKANVYAMEPVSISYNHTGYNISDLVFAIPESEITSGWGVEQNADWATSRPSGK